MMIILYLFFICLFFSTNPMEENKNLSSQEYYLDLQPQLKEKFLVLPHEIQIYIATILYTPLHLWFEKQRFQHDKCVYSACFNKDEIRILTASDDKTARIWDIKTGKELQRFQHDNYVNSAYFNNNETFILTASGDRTARIWDIKTGNKLQRFQHDN